MNKDRFRAWIVVVVTAVLFVVAAYGAREYRDALVGIVGVGGATGMVSYVLLTIVAVVVAPVSSAPLIPVATSLWGVLWAAILSIVGWTIGAMVAFALARRYGLRLMGRIAFAEKLESMRRRLPARNIFWTVVILRMTVPVDVLSYALGLFSPIGWREYFLATLIGVTPFSFVFAYAGILPIRYQAIGLAVGAAVLLWSYRRRK